MGLYDGHAEDIPEPVKMPVDVLELAKPDAPPEPPLPPNRRKPDSARATIYDGAETPRRQE